MMGGKVVLEKSGNFYLNVDGVNMEMYLVAEGLRKIAMIARLIATGSLVDKGFLFWDEPEANLNPKIVRDVANTILHLCKSGIQVTIATHSLFLLREFELLLIQDENKAVKTRFFGLPPGDDGVEVSQETSIVYAGDITALDEDFMQSDRLMESEGA